MNKCGEVGLSGKTIGKAHIHTASNSFTQSAVFLKVGWRGNAVQTGVFGGKSARLAEDKKNTQWAQQRGRDLQIAWFVTKKNKHLEALNSAAVHRPTLKRKKKTASGGKEKKWREVSWICFPNAVTFLAAPQLVLAKGGWEEVGWREVERERAHCFSFFPPLFAPRLKVNMPTLFIDVP